MRGEWGHTVQRNANLTTVPFFEFIAVNLHRGSVGNQQAVADNPRLSRAVSHRALDAITRVARGEGTIVISKNTDTPGLIESDPVLDLGSKGLEYHSGIACEVGDEFLLVERSTVPLVKLIRKVPVVESNHGGNARINQVIHKLLVELYAFLVDRIVPAAERDNARPIHYKLGLANDIRIEARTDGHRDKP